MKNTRGVPAVDRDEFPDPQAAARTTSGSSPKPFFAFIDGSPLERQGVNLANL
jgi:hypothetical protein